MDASSVSAAQRSIILMVDDDSANLNVLGRLLHPYYDVLAAPSGERALAIAAGEPKPDLILLDVLMPFMDGYTVLARLRENPATREIPVIFVTGMNTSSDEKFGLEHGAVDYVTKPFNPPVVLARVRTQLQLKRARDWLQDQNAFLEDEVERRMQDILLIQDVTIKVLAELAETRDNETGNHIRRTQEYVRILARRMQANPVYADYLTDKTVVLLAKSAPLHDIGKVGIPDHILHKPGKLTPQEWVIMQTHSALGAQAIERAMRNVDHRVDFLDIAKDIAHFHHERWDGGGYPDGLKGDAIPIPARVMAVADVFDALISRRVYKPAMPFEQARQIIADESGHHFDPGVVAPFIAGFPDFVAVAERYRESSQ